MYAAHRHGESAIAARAPADTAAGPETDATAPNPQVKTRKQAGSRFSFDAFTSGSSAGCRMIDGRMLVRPNVHREAIYHNLKLIF